MLESSTISWKSLNGAGKRCMQRGKPEIVIQSESRSFCKDRHALTERSLRQIGLYRSFSDEKTATKNNPKSRKKTEWNQRFCTDTRDSGYERSIGAVLIWVSARTKWMREREIRGNGGFVFLPTTAFSSFSPFPRLVCVSVWKCKARFIWFFRGHFRNVFC